MYLDTCVIVGFYDEKDKHHKGSTKFFRKIIKMEKISIFCSPFVKAELTWVLIKKPHFKEDNVLKIINNDILLKRIGNCHFENVNIKGKERKYDFPHFFADVEKTLLDTKPRPHLADAIHATIMKRGKIKEIITYNKEDFENIDYSAAEKIKVNFPEDIK